jgi:hypothetical protein
MADGGIGEAALLDAALTGAAVGGGVSMLSGRDPLQGALMGGLTGGLFSGAGSLFSDVPAGVDAFTAEQAAQAAQAPVVDASFASSPGIASGTPVSSYSSTMNASTLPSFGSAPPPVDLGAGTGVSSGLPFQTGGQNVLQNQLGATAGGAPAVNPDIMATGAGGAGSSTTISPAVNSVATGAGATPAATGGAGLSSLLPTSTAGKVMLGGGLGLAALMNKENQKYGVPATEKYSGPLSKFSYDPMTYRPDVVNPPTNPYRPQYASGGSINHYDIGGEIGGAINSIGDTVGSALGGVGNLINNVGQGRISLADQPQTMSWDDPRYKAHMEAMMQGKQPPQYASGGITSLGSYSDGGRMLKGPGDGMSDSIPARIGRKQEARLADGEFVVPADVVSHLGNGSTDAGAKQLYSMMDKVRQARTGRKSQGREISPHKYMPA